jgi:DNA-directed RNA polymerase subunit RPC12/RpoP
MKCTECGKRDMKPAYQQYQVGDDGRKTYFPKTWWVRTSENTWKEVQPYICTRCGSVRAGITGRAVSAKEGVDYDRDQNGA